jgi:hypothetical protein
MARGALTAALPSGPFLEPSGDLSSSWRGFLMSLWVRTGGALGLSPAVVQGNVEAEAVTRANADAALQANINANAGTLLPKPAGGVTWTAGTGLPTASQPRGSLYSRLDGAVGTTLYVSQSGGAWLPVAGV